MEAQHPSKYRISSHVIAAWTGFSADWVQNAHNVSRHLNAHSKNAKLNGVLNDLMQVSALGMSTLVEQLKGVVGSLPAAR